MWLDLGTSTVVQRHWSVWQAQGGPQGQLRSAQHTLLLPRKKYNEKSGSICTCKKHSAGFCYSDKSPDSHMDLNCHLHE